MLGKSELLKKDLKTKVVKIESLNDTIKLQELSGGDIAKAVELSKEDDVAGTRFIVKQSLIDENDNQLFKTKEEVEQFFAAKPHKVIREVIEACVAFSKIDADVEDIKEEAKN